jgi:hypothetical protein
VNQCIVVATSIKSDFNVMASVQHQNKMPDRLSLQNELSMQDLGLSKRSTGMGEALIISMEIMIFLKQENLSNVLVWLRVSSPNADLSNLYFSMAIFLSVT